MDDPFYDFEWFVAPDYRWQPWLDSEGTPLVVPSEGFFSLESELAIEMTWNRQQESGERTGPVLEPVVGPKQKVRRYRPMGRENAALFKEFAELDYHSPEAMLGFARRYGQLGVANQTQAMSYRGADGRPLSHSVSGESFLDWALEICLMREGLQLSNRRRRSNEHERRLSWLFDRNLQHVQGRLRITKARGRRLVLAPLKLISAMWLQLALAITGDKTFLACKFCRRMFEISTDEMGFRSHREFCSDSCKTKDYRKRKRTALALAADGLRAPQVAKQLDTDVATVRNWLTGAKAKGLTKGKKGA